MSWLFRFAALVFIVGPVLSPIYAVWLALFTAGRSALAWGA